MWRNLKQLGRLPHRLTKGSGDAAPLLPVLVDTSGRDGSTLMMRLLATSPEIAAPGPYPYEEKYFALLWRWSRLLERPDESDLWGGRDLAPGLQHERIQRWMSEEAIERALAHQGAGRRADRPSPGASRPPRTGGGQTANRPTGLASGPRRAAAKAQLPMSRHIFDLAWREFSRRAAQQVREEHGDPDAEVRYYAEKSVDTWLVELDELPPLKVLVLLRDPRDTFVSYYAFDAKRRREHRARFEGSLPGLGETYEERTVRFIERERERLRWIAGLSSSEGFPVFRYEDLVTDLPRQARRLEDWLSVRLAPELAAGDTEMQTVHVSARTPEASVGRWKREMRREIAELFNRELEDELEAFGYQGGGQTQRVALRNPGARQS